MSDRDHETPSVHSDGTLALYIAAVAAVVIALAPWVTQDIASLGWLRDPAVLRAAFAVLGVFVVGFAIVRSRQRHHEALALDREILAMREDGDVTLARIADRLDRLKN